MITKQAGDGAAQASGDLVVFSIIRDSKYAECGEELWKDALLVMETGRPLCLHCSDLDHLVYLGRGDAALTRRAKKYSALSAVVVRFSRSRGHYERQGLLVEEAALDRAEKECLDDAGQRAARRERDEVRREGEDRELVGRMTDAIREQFPGCPAGEARAIAAHAAKRGSGRVGRTAAGKALDEGALTLAVRAAIRHRHTRYDEFLMTGSERMDARERVRGDVERTLDPWRLRLGI
ncbi:MAG: DUF2293 domain-containing protein [Bryobacteraceae bacterium]